VVSGPDLEENGDAQVSVGFEFQNQVENLRIRAQCLRVGMAVQEIEAQSL
jgi:hypothetical protein